MILGILIVAAVLFFIVARMVETQSGDAISGQSMFEQSVDQRIAPIGRVNVQGQANTEQAASAAVPAAAHPRLTGEQVVTQTCMACHGTGAMGAPKIGNKADWAPRAAQGFGVLFNAATHGLRAMPPRGGNSSLSDGDIKRAISYMLGKTGIKIKGMVDPNKISAASAKAPAASSAAQTSNAAASSAPATGTNFKDIQAMMQKAGCFACHAVDHKIVGPSYKDVAKRYKGQRGATVMLAEKVIKGGAGHWNAITGGVPMPPHPNLTKAQAEAMVKWVLAR